MAHVRCKYFKILTSLRHLPSFIFKKQNLHFFTVEDAVRTGVHPFSEVNITAFAIGQQAIEWQVAMAEDKIIGRCFQGFFFRKNIEPFLIFTEEIIGFAVVVAALARPEIGQPDAEIGM